MLDLEDALQRLAERDPAKARLVELRYFGGLSIEEAAEVLEISPATLKRQWTTARACPQEIVVNLLDTQMGLVEAGQGMALIPSFGLPMGRQQKLAVTQLVKPTVYLDFHQINNRARPPSQDAVDFSAFLRPYGSRWAGRSGVV